MPNAREQHRSLASRMTGLGQSRSSRGLARLSLPAFLNEQTFSGAVGMSQRCTNRDIRLQESTVRRPYMWLLRKGTA
jgi:hypothetical protein